MFAVIETGGKQYRVAEGDLLQVEKLPGTAGDKVTLDRVLMVAGGKAPVVGAPLVEGAAVKAEIVAQTRAAKIIVFKKRRRQNYRRTYGHRQDLTLLRITAVSAKGDAAAAKDAKAS